MKLEENTSREAESTVQALSPDGSGFATAKPETLTPPLHSVPELSEILERSKSTIYRWIRQGKLTTTKVHGVQVVPVTESNNKLIMEEIRNNYK